MTKYRPKNRPQDTKVYTEEEIYTENRVTRASEYNSYTEDRGNANRESRSYTEGSGTVDENYSYAAESTDEDWDSADRAAKTDYSARPLAEEYESEYPEQAPAKPKKKKWPIVLACVLGGIIVLVAGLLIAVHIITGGFKRTTLDTEDLGIVETTTTADNVEKITKITNIAFFGIDTRDFLPQIGDQYRSDSMIIMSINPMNNTIKMTSILRDTKAPIEGYGALKINSAYQKGGPTLAIKTLNTNFKLDIEDYVTVDFGELAEVIDIVGGVDIELTYNEAEMVNFYSMDEMHYYDSFAYEGWNHLCGAQAVSYARIRNLDTDVFRASRQQTVLTALFNQVKATPKSEYPALITQLLGSVETSLSYAEIISLIASIDVSSAELIKNTVPDVNYQENIWGGYDESIDAWVWIYDLDAAAERIHTIIYGTEGNGEGETEVPTVDPNTSDITY